MGLAKHSAYAIIIAQRQYRLWIIRNCSKITLSGTLEENSADDTGRGLYVYAALWEQCTGQPA